MNQPKIVLYAEDQLGDQRLLSKVFSASQNPPKLILVEDGEEAIKFLEETHSLPDLILMDINMIPMDGLTATLALKTNPQIRHIPIVILTTSYQAGDVQKAYECGANAYLSKPVNLDEYKAMLKTIEDFWLIHNRIAKGGIC